MSGKNCVPKTYLNHPNQWKLKALLEELFTDDFPLLEGTYSRTILFRSDNGYEAMAARWSPGTISSIHGHPYFALIIVTKGRLGVDYFKKHDGQMEMTKSGLLSESQFFSDVGQTGTFDNHIHRVQAYEETLSIHISSDDAAKGETFG
jgi:predicted metal-dependent enzyme (double-stranded beta helix superfamily)